MYASHCNIMMKMEFNGQKTYLISLNFMQNMFCFKNFINYINNSSNILANSDFAVGALFLLH